MMLIITSGESNLTKRPHCRRTWTIQSHSPGCTNVLTIQNMLPWTHPQLHIHRFSYFCTAHGRESNMVLFAVVCCCLRDPCLSALYVPWCEKTLYKYSSFPFLSYTLHWAFPFPPQNCPLHGGLEPSLMHSSSGPPESTTQMASQSVQRFLHGSRLW